jgi:mannose-1-phosphate guanylyltransferase
VPVSSTDAVILVGGLGTRLRPLTLSVPKPLIPTAGVPFLAHMIARIREAGVTRVLLGTSYQAEVFEAEFGDGSSLGVDLEYIVESEPLGTGGGIRNVADRLRGDTVLVFNGDVLSGVDLRALMDQHHRMAADVTLYLTKVSDPRQFGCVPTDESGRVTAFLEKSEAPPTDQINAGTYVFRREVIDTIPTGRPVSVERETFPGLLSAGARVFGHVDPCYWRDLGRPADFVAGSADLVQGLAPSPLLPGAGAPFRAMPGAQIDPGATVCGGATIGAGCRVGAGAVVDGSVLLAGSSVEPGAVVRRSVLGFDATVGPEATLDDVVIGDRARIGARVELCHGARVWPDVELPDGSVRFSSDV